MQNKSAHHGTNSKSGPTVQLNLPILLPNIDEDDQCIARLTERLRSVRGITDAHIIKIDGANNDELCLHYDSNLVSLDQLKQLALQTGAEITNR